MFGQSTMGTWSKGSRFRDEECGDYLFTSWRYLRCKGCHFRYLKHYSLGRVCSLYWWVLAEAHHTRSKVVSGAGLKVVIGKCIGL